MLPDSTLPDIASRIDENLKRIERLETLERTTVAFPTGSGGCVCIQHIDLTVNADFIEFGPGLPGGIIPQTHRHALIVHQAATFLLIGGTRTQQLNFNGDFTASYEYFWRQEFLTAAPPVGSSDVDHDAAAAPLMEVGTVPARDSGAVAVRYFTAGTIWMPNYTKLGIGTTKFQSVVWDNASREGDNAGIAGRRIREAGSGWYQKIGAITTIRLTCSGAQFFNSGSNWDLILCCPITS